MRDQIKNIKQIAAACRAKWESVRRPRWMRISTYRGEPSTLRRMRLKDYLALARIKEKEYPFEQIKFLLYFISEVAGIRDDMTPKVIASRLNNINPTIPDSERKTEDDIAAILSVHGNVFEEHRWETSNPINNDRSAWEKAYSLTYDAKLALKKSADDLWLDYFWERTPLTKLTKSQSVFYYSAACIALLAPLTILAILFFVYNTESSYNPELLNRLDKPTLIVLFMTLVIASSGAAYQIGRGRKSRLTGDPPKLQSYLALVDIKGRKYCDQIKLLLYFVTEFAGIRDDMTPKVIASRLQNFGTRIDTAQAAAVLKDEKIFIESEWDEDSPVNDDRKPWEKAYRLTREMIEQLTKETDKLWREYFWSLTPFTKIEYVAFYVVMPSLVVVGLVLHVRYGGESIYSLICFWFALVLGSYINGDTSPPSGRR